MPTYRLLRAYFRRFEGEAHDWSLDEYADLLGRSRAQVGKALAALADWGEVQVAPRFYGRSQLPSCRTLAYKRDGGVSPSGISDQVDLTLSPGWLDLRADHPAHARGETAPSVPARVEVPELGNRRHFGNRDSRAGRERNEGEGRLRRPRGRLRPPAGVDVPLDLLARLEARQGRHGAAAALAVMREAGTRAHPAAALLAARTLAERDARVPGALFRHLYRQAVAGDVLVDRALEAERVRAAEAAEWARGGADLDELEARLAAVRISGGDPDQAARLEAEVARLRRELGRPPPVPKRARVAPASPAQEKPDCTDPVMVAAALESIAISLRAKRDACK